jgi:RsiW-degrading membrane proteinase PrsW (M82 family)
MVLGTFAVPLASLMLVWELNTPRNMSIITVLRFVIVGGGCSIVITMLAYLVPFLSGDNILIPGFVEETAKILAVVIVTWGATSRRYPYQLNGILIGCAVGSGFACIETLGYGLDAYSQTLIQLIGQAQNGTPLAPIFAAATTVMVDNLTMRGVLAPFGHVVWCAISAGALWRVKGDKPVSFAMLLDGRFLGAFAIVMAMHDLWDISIAFPNNAFLNSTAGQACGWIITGAISWYVLFTMVQQGLHQVRDMKKAQLEHTVAHVEATLGLGTKRYPMQPQAPAGV